MSEKKPERCYIYTRVSTAMQVDGYSLDAQKDKLRGHAKLNGMTVVGEYSDEGKSGKNTEGRPDFVRMLNDIESHKDKVDVVLVVKLSRFGRNTAEILSCIQTMENHGVGLICTEDYINSLYGSGKLIISVLSAVSEIERHNIKYATMSGRVQKAKSGKWNGGFAPYGYKLIDGELHIAEDEVDVIKIIYHKFVHENMGLAAIAKYLNTNGYKKKKRQNNTLDKFATSFIKGVLDNPVYCGKLAYGRRKTEKVLGKTEVYHIVKQSEFPVYDGVQEAIITEEEWFAAQAKRKLKGYKHEKVHSLDHEHILSGIVKCPICGSGLYGNVARKKKPIKANADGTTTEYYKDYFYYACKHRLNINGHFCTYRKQWKEEKVNDAVAEVIKKLVSNPKFAEIIKDKIGSKIDTTDLEHERDALQQEYNQASGAKDRIGRQMDTLDITDRNYDKKYETLQARWNSLFDEMSDIEDKMEEIKTRIFNIEQDKITGKNIYKYLLYFNDFYDSFTDLEKKEFMNLLVERVDLYEEEQPDGRFLKHIKFRFPIFFDDKEIEEISLDNETTLECCVLLCQEESKFNT